MVNDRDLWSKTSSEFFLSTEGTDGPVVSVLTAPAALSCWKTEVASSCLVFLSGQSPESEKDGRKLGI